MTTTGLAAALYDYKNEFLEPVESHIRDDLNVNINHWCLFRRAINCGTSAQPPEITFNVGQQSVDKQDAYLDLGKSNYEVICGLGYAKQALEDIKAIEITNYGELLRFMRLSKEFYFHTGSVLDNLARLIYIINDKDSHSAIVSKKNTTLRRRYISWGDIEKDINSNHPDYVQFVRDMDMQEFRYVRHFLTHVWAPPKQVSPKGELTWPEQIRSARVYAWPHDALDQSAYKALTFVPIVDMIERDWKALETFQNKVFEQLTKDVTGKFEPNYGCTILPIT
jgi:hypothetical protein